MENLTKRTRKKPKQRYSQLIETAVLVFSEQGFNKSAHRTIAKECNCSVPTVFNYFKNTEHLQKSVTKHVLEFIESSLMTYLNDEYSIVDYANAWSILSLVEPKYVKVLIDIHSNHCNTHSYISMRLKMIDRISDKLSQSKNVECTTSLASVIYSICIGHAWEHINNLGPKKNVFLNLIEEISNESHHVASNH